MSNDWGNDFFDQLNKQKKLLPIVAPETMNNETIILVNTGTMKYEDFTDTHYIVRKGAIKKGDLAMISSYSNGLYGAFRDVSEEYRHCNISNFRTVIRKKKSKLARLGIKI